MSYHPIIERARALGVKQIRLVIYQPKVYNGPREYTLPLSELSNFADDARLAAKAVDGAAKMFDNGKFSREEWDRIYLHQNPNEEDCAFCKAMATCPAAQTKVQAVIGADFGTVIETGAEAQLADALTQAQPADLDQCMSAVGFVEDWCKAVRAECERRLLAGEDMPNWGLELGRQGPRKWADAAEAERYLRDTVRLKIEDAYNLKLRSPTQIEELSKGNDPLVGPRQWKKLTAMVTRAEPKPSVKPKAAITKPYTPTPPSGADFNPVVEDDLI